MDAGVKVSIIAAVAENGVIGRSGDLPWRLKSDLQRFKRLTHGKTVIVGRKTHESILRRLGHPLEGRRTIVVTRDRSYASECEVVHSFTEALERAKNDGEVFVIGGAELYRAALPLASRLYLTTVEARPEGDTHFPPCDMEEWPVSDRVHVPADDGNDHASTFCTRERRWMQGPMNLEHARHPDQRTVMEELAGKGLCNFCPENRSEGDVLGSVWQGRHWVLVPNRWPYEFTALHLLAIPERHVIFPNELTREEWEEFRELLDWAIQEYKLEAGSLGMRFGVMRLTGATVEHLHVHLIVADPDVTKPGYERVRFPMGPKPPGEEKAPDA